MCLNTFFFFNLKYVWVSFVLRFTSVHNSTAKRVHNAHTYINVYIILITTIYAYNAS